jgi:DNA-binding beta-propeller fold protein YncE
MNFRNVAISLVVFSTVSFGQLEVVATGLQSPQKIVVTPAGNILVSETNLNPNAGRISVVSRGGARRTLFDAFPSGQEVAGGASGPTAMALRGRVLYVAMGGGDTERRGERLGTSMHNPQGTSSPLFASILAIQFNRDVDEITGPFTMTTAHQRALGDGDEIRMEDATGGTATISVLTRLPISEPDSLTIYRFSNPWGMGLSEDGRTMYVTDASTNALVRIDTNTGRWQRIVRFPPNPNAGPVGPPVIDAVPTSVRIYGDQLLVSFLTGFPFLPNAARVLLVDPNARTSQPFIFWLTSATDVIWRPTSGPRPQFFALEFSTNQTATPPAPGRLLRYDGVEPQVVSSDLRAAVSMAFDLSANELYVLELTGRLLRLRLN